jgi:hypothetical protein
VTLRRKMSIVRHHENVLRDAAQENVDRQTSRKRIARRCAGKWRSSDITKKACVTLCRKMATVTVSAHHEHGLSGGEQENDDRQTSRKRVARRCAGKCRSSHITKTCCVTLRRKMTIITHHEHGLSDAAQESDDRHTSRTRVE